MREKSSPTEGYGEPLGNRLATSLELLGLVTGTLAVAATPWFLGGAIPQARLVLLTGAVIAASLGLLGGMLGGRIPNVLPKSMMPILALAALCIIQLLPVFAPPITGLNHSVHSSQLSEITSALSLPDSAPASVMPWETRLYLAQFIALSLLVWVFWQLVDSSFRLQLVLSILVLDGVLQAGLGLSQTFGATTVAVGNSWKVSPTAPFGCFVNPNNAAGWFLCVAMASMLLVALLFSSGRPAADLQVAHSRGKAILRDLQFRLSQLSIVQIFAVFGSALILMAAVATLSRGGIVATVIACGTFIVSRLRRGGWLTFAAGMSALVFLCVAGLMLFDLDTLAIKELRTLKDPVSASTLRLLHWGDTLPHAADFPLIGTGFGAYRYATLPYQQHYWGTWFQRADNQYLEVLVEGGIAGLLLVVLFGFGALFLAIRVCMAGNDRRRSPAASWLASCVLATGIGIAAAAFLDYGVSLPSVSSLIVVYVAMLERRGTAPPSSSRWSLLTIVTVLGMVCAGGTLAQDLWNAGEVYDASAAAQRFLKLSPGSTDATAEAGVAAHKKLQAAIQLRPDDLESVRIYNQLTQWLWRDALCDYLIENRLIKPDEKPAIITKLALPTMAEQLLSTSEVDRSRWAEVWNKLSTTYPWFEESVRLADSSPWVPDLALDLSAWTLVTGDHSTHNLLVRQLVMDPGAGRDLYLLGSVLQSAGKLEEAQAAWNGSLLVSERFRPSILERAVSGADPASAFQKYGPDTYRGCIECAEQMQRSPQFRDQLLTRAEQLWPAVEENLDPQKAVLRARYLLLSSKTAEAEAWLREVQGKWPVSTEIRAARASCLEALDRIDEAYDEWIIIQTLEPDNEVAPVAMKRLADLPPKLREVKK